MRGMAIVCMKVHPPFGSAFSVAVNFFKIHTIERLMSGRWFLGRHPAFDRFYFGPCGVFTYRPTRTA